MHAPTVCTRQRPELISASARDISTTMALIQSKLVALKSQRPLLLNQDEFTKGPHRTTLSRRAKGEIQSREDYREQYRFFTQAQKQRLLEYIDEFTRRGLLPNHRNVRIFAYNICGIWPGQNWASKFVKTYRDTITSQYFIGFDISRKKADNW